MADRKIDEPKDAVERNITLVGELMDYLIRQPEVFNSLPDAFELVILPEDDPEMRLYNLDLLDIYGSEGKPIVFARTESSQKSTTKRAEPSLYVPIAV
jgi:hypothetical protein